MKLFLTILLLSATWSQAETLTQLRNRVDLWLSNHVGGASGLVSKQNAYFATNGRYWQGLITFSAFPEHTTSTVADASADRLTLHPTDQTSSWNDFVPNWSGETFAAAAKIDVYDGPTGIDKGWILHVFVRYSGTTYERQKVFGTQTNLDFAWRVFVPE